MAVNTNIGIAAAKDALDAVVDRLDVGTAANARLRIYSGAQPDSPDDVVGTGTLLAEIDLGTADVFGDATTGIGGEDDTATATAIDILPKTQTSATAPGTAAWFRAVDKDATAVIDGSVGTADADLILDNTSIAAEQEVKLNSWKVKLPKE
jgi:hypothetical protein